MTPRSRALAAWPVWAPASALVALVLLDLGSGRQLSGVYAGAAVLASIRSGSRRTAGFAAVAVLAAAASGGWNHNLGDLGWVLRLAACAGIGAVAVVSARVHEREQARLHRTTVMAQRVLDALAVELTGARTVKDVADGFVGHAVGTLGALSAMVSRLDEDDVLRTVTWHGRGTSAVADRYEEIGLGEDIPGARAVREGRALHFRSLAEIERAFPRLDGYYDAERSMHLLPLGTAEQRRLGLLALTFPPGAFGADEDAFLHSLAGALTSALARARELQAYDAEVQRTALLAEASMTLSRSLDTETTAEEVGRLLVPRFADWLSLAVLREGELETIAVHHRDPETTAWARGMTGEFPTRMDAPTGAPNVIRTGRSELYPYIPAELVEASATSEEHLALLRRLGFTSAIVAPLRGREGVFGALTLIHAESGRRYDEADVPFLEEVADRVALALDTATTFAQQSERLADVTQVAQAAQLAILAPPPERMGAVALSARYVSAAAEAQVGGDLYEVLQGPNSVRVLVGDVRGKGLSAVRTATVVLGAFRAAAAVHDDLSAVAVEIDRRIGPFLLDGEEFVTAVLLDIAPDGAFTVVTCGHPAPVLLHPDGAVATVLVEPDPPLGLGVAPRPSHGRLAAGDRLLLFTDGLIEARDTRGDFVDPACLLPAVARAPFADALEELLAAFRAAVGHALGDDLALLLVGYDPQVSRSVSGLRKK